MVDFTVSHSIGFCVVAPDDPLALGAVDRLHEAGIPCFGPDAKAARIESSKVFSKELMKKYGIPTADYQVFDDPAEALLSLRDAKYPAVIKADGLALGKGVVIAQDYPEAERAVKSIMEDKVFGASGNQIVVEEFLTGPEVSVLSFTDGRTLVPMPHVADPTAAGDSFVGAFCTGLTAGLTQEQALTFASHAAAITVSRMGVNPSRLFPRYHCLCRVCRFLALTSLMTV